MLLGGLDVGSSGCKVTVFNESGGFVESRYRAYDSVHSDSEHTIDFVLIIAAVGEVIEALENKPDALAVTTFGESFVLLDRNDRILNNAMLYNDHRGSEECRTFDREQTARITYTAPAPLYTLPKLMWYVKYRPDLLERADKLLLIPDFIIYSLCGERAINYSSAARTMGLDIKNNCWSAELFEHIGFDRSNMSPLVPDGTVVGVSNRFGLKNAKIISAMHDQNAAALGAGALSAGDCVDGSGSVECLTPIISKLPDGIDSCLAGVAYLPYLDGLFEGCAFSYTGGTALKWFRDNLGDGSSYRELDAGLGDKVGSILFLPHLAGAATPYMDPDSRGMLYGLTLGSTRLDICRAVMEGVAYEMRINLELLSSCGVKPSRLLATGGGAKSRVWNRIKSNITGLPITVIDQPEVGACGAVMLAARSLGAVSDLEEAKRLFVREGETILPDNAKHARYNELFESYREMYDLSKKLRTKP